MSSFTRALSLPSSSASLPCAVALNNIQRGSATQNAPKLTIFRKKIKKIWDGAHLPPQTNGEGDTPSKSLKVIPIQRKEAY